MHTKTATGTPAAEERESLPPAVRGTLGVLMETVALLEKRVEALENEARGQRVEITGDPSRVKVDLIEETLRSIREEVEASSFDARLNALNQRLTRDIRTVAAMLLDLLNDVRHHYHGTDGRAVLPSTAPMPPYTARLLAVRDGGEDDGTYRSNHATPD